MATLEERICIDCRRKLGYNEGAPRGDGWICMKDFHARLYKKEIARGDIILLDNGLVCAKKELEKTMVFH